MKVTITIEAELIPIERPIQLGDVASTMPSLGKVLSEFEGLLEHDAGIETFERMRVLTASIT